MQQKLFPVAAWTVFGLIVLATLSPIGLRPQTGHVGIERFAAFCALGTLYVAAYPHRFVQIIALVPAAAFTLELLQHLTPDRHGHLIDAIEKIVGALVGCGFARLYQTLARGQPPHS
ncbi:VanZ family protein [Bradyrhizobium sp. CIAT3101]|uniref:VanZ family protein n=1 Tax=Bradyrhizobium sp. CIAT3101 TaxID=439387 RepID=UPI0024B1076F|nr:VanZ family protein [Bradyrhizobium sp. CIAT3101]WFU79112.1 VanZ family protein [Bradyrhizobium sp. CIAT3101]